MPFRVAILIASLCLLGCQQRVRSFGPLEVGAPVPGFGGVSMSGTHISPTSPAGKFFLFVIDDDLPPTCLDGECGASGRLVARKGGHMIGGSDGKLAQAFGVVPITVNSTFRPIKSVVVVGDSAGKITAIYRGASVDDAKRVMAKEGL